MGAHWPKRAKIFGDGNSDSRKHDLPQIARRITKAAVNDPVCDAILSMALHR